MSARLSDELPKDEDGVLFALLGHLEVRNNIITIFIIVIIVIVIIIIIKNHHDKY
jgi:hypothetical protein